VDRHPPVALPRPLVLRLPRVKFRKPRWPRGDRLDLVLACLFTVVEFYDVFCFISGAKRLTLYGSRHVTGPDVVLCGLIAAYYWLRWWYSRREDNDNDDGPSAT
jgi:hypothetical protein